MADGGRRGTGLPVGTRRPDRGARRGSNVRYGTRITRIARPDGVSVVINAHERAPRHFVHQRVLIVDNSAPETADNHFAERPTQMRDSQRRTSAYPGVSTIQRDRRSDYVGVSSVGEGGLAARPRVSTIPGAALGVFPGVSAFADTGRLPAYACRPFGEVGEAISRACRPLAENSRACRLFGEVSDG
jgi:hypothetical protein